MMKNGMTWWLCVVALFIAGSRADQAGAAELRVGGATVSITPDQPVALSGQMRARISKTVESPVLASALAIEAREGDKVIDSAIMVACDLVSIRAGVLDEVRAALKERLPDFEGSKLFLSATHTHTAPEMLDGRFNLPSEGIMQPGEYTKFLTQRIADAAVQAWEARQQAGVSWGLGHAVIAQNRRSVYANGEAKMYGKTNLEEFRGIEGYEDHGVEVLFFWDRENKLIATAVNVACPAQEVEGRSNVNADYWHQVRETLKEWHGEKLTVLGWIGAAGDQSPHLMFRHAAEDRMRKLRKLERLDEIARRITHAWEEAYEGAKQEIHHDVPFQHRTVEAGLPRRIVTEEESAYAAAQAKELLKNPENLRRAQWHQAVVDRYARQQQGPLDPYPVELHILRIGDIAIATNPFELYTEYGIRMKCRSPALQTFVIQLAGTGTYLPTAAAVRGGGYSAIPESNAVGPEGGDVLVDRTLEVIRSLWENSK